MRSCLPRARGVQHRSRAIQPDPSASRTVGLVGAHATFSERTIHLTTHITGWRSFTVALVGRRRDQWPPECEPHGLSCLPPRRNPFNEQCTKAR